MKWLEHYIVLILWFLGLDHVPDLDNVHNPYLGSLKTQDPEDDQPEDEIQELKPFIRKTFVAKSNKGKSKVFEYAAYPQEYPVGETVCSDWDLEPLDVDADQLYIYKEWSKYDDFILSENGWTSDKRKFAYNQVRNGIISGMTYQEIADSLGKSLSHVKKYGGAVRSMIEYRRQSERKKDKSPG